MFKATAQKTKYTAVKWEKMSEKRRKKNDEQEKDFICMQSVFFRDRLKA